MVATQNPIEYEGTYPLPEAQLDRFLMKINVGYPSLENEVAMLKLDRQGASPLDLDRVEAVTDPARLLELPSRRFQAVRITDDVLNYLAELIRQTRDLPSVELGASPRAGVHLLAAARGLAALAGREFVTPDDISRMSIPVLSHRILIRPEAEIERYTAVEAIRQALSATTVPR